MTRLRIEIAGDRFTAVLKSRNTGAGCRGSPLCRRLCRNSGASRLAFGAHRTHVMATYSLNRRTDESYLATSTEG